VHADVIDGIRALDAAGLRLVTLSNGASSLAAGLVARNGIDGCFERLLSVQDAPAWKPAAAAYRHALDTCEVEPADAMLVAVHPWDIHGARSAGLSTAWVNRSGGRYPRHFFPQQSRCLRSPSPPVPLCNRGSPDRSGQADTALIGHAPTILGESPATQLIDGSHVSAGRLRRG
jgi:hypothetical protein